MSNAILDDIFSTTVSATEGVVLPYSDLLDRVVSSCSGANVVLESQQWSKIAAIQQGNCSIFERDAFAGDSLPFDPSEVAVQITYLWDGEEYDLAWVATWPYDV